MKDWFKCLLVATIAIIATVKACESEPKTIIKTETKIVTVHDTINTVEISEPKIVYVHKELDKIVYKTDTIIKKDSIKANQYSTKLTSNKATADLKITTTGQLLDVSGVITYPEKETTTTITKIKDKSGLFLYGKTRTDFNSLEVGLNYQFKNTFMISGGIEHDLLNKQTYAKIGIGIKIF